VFGSNNNCGRQGAGAFEKGSAEDTLLEKYLGKFELE
jgi:hypothetical protein